MKTASVKIFYCRKWNNRLSEAIILSALLTIFLIINLIQAPKLTLLEPWQDQVMFIDPAINLYFGNGFTSSAWFAQTNDRFWAGYPPLYSFLLYLWIRLFGFGLHTGHSLNCLIIATSVLLLWISVIKLNLINSARIRLIFTSILLLELSYINNFQRGRPDVLMACLISIILFIYSIQKKRLRYLFLIAVSLLFPFAGLALVAYIGILGFLLLIYSKNSLLKEFISIFCGVIIGFLCLYLLYKINGVWPDFIKSVLANPTLTAIPSKAKMGGVFGNRVLQILEILCCSLFVLEAKKGQFNKFSPLSFSLISIFYIPLGMRLAGAFPFYYSWMVVFPVSIGFFYYLDKLLKSYLDHWLKFSVLGFILISNLIISPYSGFVDLLLNWEASDYSHIESFIQERLAASKKDSQWIFSDPISYFTVKKEGRVVLYKCYLDSISSEEKRRVGILVIRPQDFPKMKNLLGGRWYKHGESLVIQRKEKTSELVIYKRE